MEAISEKQVERCEMINNDKSIYEYFKVFESDKVHQPRRHRRHRQRFCVQINN